MLLHEGRVMCVCWMRVEAYRCIRRRRVEKGSPSQRGPMQVAALASSVLAAMHKVFHHRCPSIPLHPVPLYSTSTGCPSFSTTTHGTPHTLLFSVPSFFLPLSTFWYKKTSSRNYSEQCFRKLHEKIFLRVNTSNQESGQVLWPEVAGVKGNVA